MIKNLLLIVGLLLLTLHSMAATVRGTLKDKNGKPIAFALLKVEESNITATSNENGAYELELSEGDYVIVASYMNYVSTAEYIEVGTEDIKLDFTLIHQEYQLQEVVVTDKMEDLGVRIMRKVIQKRKEHEKQIQSLETEIYLKGSLKLMKTPTKVFGITIADSNKAEMGLDSAGQGIVYLLEQHTDYYYQAPNKTYNKIKSVRTSGDSRGLGFAQMPSIINIYENNIEILQGLNDRGFISPASTNALLYYNFKFEGGYEDKGVYINKIKVTPKRRFEPLFEGYVYVIDDKWIFSAVALTLTRESGIDILDTLTLQQTYRPYGNTDIWIIQNQAIIPYLNLMGFGIGGSFITNYNEQKLNETIDPSVFKSKYLSEYENDALDKSKEYWDSTRVIPLTTEEVKDFVKKDSMEVVYKEKSLENANKTFYTFGLLPMILTGSGISKGEDRFRINPIIEMINFNSVEGLNLTVSPTFTKKLYNNQSITAKLSTRYGFSGKDWYNKGMVHYRKNDTNMQGKYWSATIEGGRYISDITNLEPMTEFYNTFSTLYGWNYLKFYESNFLNLNFKTNKSNGWNYQLNARYEDRSPLENTNDYTFEKANKSRLTPNNPPELPTFNPHQALVISGSINYQPGWKYIKYPKYVSPVPSGAPIFSLAYSKGIADILGSDVDFDKIQVGIRHSVRMKLLGVLDYNIIGGGFLNKTAVGNPDYNHIIGNQVILSSTHYLNSYQIAPYYRYSNVADVYLRAHAEWHLAGLLSNKVPLFKRLNWHFVAGTNTLFINQNDYYAEVFAGIENIGFNIMRFGRVDFVLGYQSGLAKPSFGFRIGINPKFFSVATE